MSALGSTFEYDVFFSYAWATNTGDPYLRDWCRKIADTIVTLLKQRFNGDNVNFHAYLDRDQAKTAQDLDQELQAATGRSAIFVAMVSNYYTSDYCQREMNWFCDKLAVDRAAIADHVCVLRMQKVGDGKWPSRFTAANGAPLMYLDFCNSSGQPIDMAKFMLNGSLEGLADPVEKAALEIADKISEIGKKLSAKAEFQRLQKLPDMPLFFIEAETRDRQRWTECGLRLKEVPGIVLPALGPMPATATPNGTAFSGCDGLVMLRSRPEDEIGERIKSAYLLLRTISPEKTPKWALLDELDDPPPECGAFYMPRVRLQGDWVPALQKALFGA
jgi:hypothetical protein